MKKSACLLCLSFLLIHCGPKQDKVERYIEDGVEVVVNHLEPYKISGRSILTLERILAIDTEDDETAALGLPDIFGFEVNSTGEIYILRNIQGDGDFVFKFDSNGKFIKSFGPQGQGPGEFQNPRHIAIDSKDNILIYDLGPQILHRYDKDGVLMGDYRMSGDEARITSGPNENMLAAVHTSESDKGRTLNTHFLKLLNPDLEVLKVIDEFSFEWRRDKARVTEPLLCWSVSRDHIYVANEARGYEIWVHDSNGKLIRKIQKEFTQIPVSEDFKNKTMEQFPEGMREQMSKMVYFPEFHPPIQNLVAGDDGLLLVSTFEEGEKPEEFMFDIINEEDVFIGRKSLKIWIWEAHLWAKIKANKLYCLEVKGSGFRELVVYNMIWE
ncbi:6-bladed beta-propeller [Acidobacteriota bacterium]